MTARTIELTTVFKWACPDCGQEQIECPAPDVEDEEVSSVVAHAMEVASNIIAEGLGIDVADARVDSPSYTEPNTVLCRSCLSHFEVA